MRIQTISMKKQIRGILSFRIIFLLLACCLVTCQDEEVGGNIPEIGKDVSFTLRVPGVGKAPEARSLTSDDENRIAPGEIHVLMFRANQDGKYEYVSCLKPRNFSEETTPGGLAYKMGILTGFSPDDLSAYFRIMIVAGLTNSELENFKERFPEANNQTDPMVAIRIMLTFGQPGNWPVTENVKRLPMWGESKGFVPGTTEDLGSITLLRAVARLDVGVNFARDNGGYPLSDMVSRGISAGNTFVLSSVDLYNVPRKGCVGPGASALESATGQVNAPTLDGFPVPGFPEATCSYAASDLTGPIGKKSLTRTLYVPEADNHTDDNTKAVCLIVGGYFNADPTPTYYRVDLYDRTPDASGYLPKPTAANRLSVLRNHVMVINITGVRMRGFDRVEDAFRADPTYMDFEVSSWDQSVDIGDITSDGIYSLSASPAEFSYYSDGSPRQFTLKTNYKGELGAGWSMTPDENAKKYVYFLSTEGDTIRWGDARWPASGPPNVENVFQMGMARFSVGGPSEVQREVRLALKAGRMSRTIVLRQTSSENLNIDLNPLEMIFGKVVLEPKELYVGIHSFKKYSLQVEWMSEDGNTLYKWNILSPAGECLDPRFDKATFFRPVPEKPGYYTLQLTENATGKPRQIGMNITAIYENGESRTVILNVVQSSNDVSWEVEGGSGTGKREIVIPAVSSSHSVRIITEAQLQWTFDTKTLEEASKWITNLGDYVGKPFTGPLEMVLTLRPNVSVNSRRVVLQAHSTEQGFDESTALLIITQLGNPPMFNITSEGSPGIVKGGDEWVLDFGETNLSSRVDASFEAGSNWCWTWDRSEPDFNARYTGTLQAFTSSVAENVPTDDHPSPPASHTWGRVMSFTSRDVGTWYNTEVAGNDNNVNRSIPKAGIHTVRMLIRHSFPDMSAGDVELYIRRLTMKRAVPAYTFVASWPYPDNSNLDLYAAAINADNGEDSTRTDGRLLLRTNAPGRLDVVENGSASVGMDVVPKNGYEQFSLRLPPGHPLEAVPGVETYQRPLYSFQLRYTGRRKQSPNGDVMQLQSWSRTYFTGTEILEPKRNLSANQRMVGSGAQQLVFDFSDSKYLLLEGRYTVYITDSDGGVIDTERTQNFTLDSRKGEQQFTLDLPPNTLINQYKKVVISVKRWIGSGVSRWEELATYVFQDALPMTNGYIVKYTQGPMSGSKVTFSKNRPPYYGGDYQEKSSLLGLNWLEISPLNKWCKGHFDEMVADTEEANAKFLTSGVKVQKDPIGNQIYNYNCSGGATITNTADGKKYYGNTAGKSYETRENIPVSQWNADTVFPTPRIKIGTSQWMGLTIELRTADDRRSLSGPTEIEGTIWQNITSYTVAVTEAYYRFENTRWTALDATTARVREPATAGTTMELVKQN